MAVDADAMAIAVRSVSGKTAMVVSRFRCPVDIVGMTTDEKVWQKLNLDWGVPHYLAENCSSMDMMFYYAVNGAKTMLGLNKGDRVVVSGGPINGQHGNINTIKVETV